MYELAEDRPDSSGPSRGNFFAIDRRCWAHVCQYGINAMCAYLVLARGTGHDQRTTSWSVNAVENHTGIGRARARAAITLLQQACLMKITKAGVRPRYYLLPASEVPG